MDLVSDIPCKNTRERLRSVLTPPTCNSSLKKLSAFIDSEEVLQRYSYASSSEIYRNLQLACVIANKTRAMINESSTHPDVNNRSAKERNTLNEMIFKMRSFNPVLNSLVLSITNTKGMLLDTQKAYDDRYAQRVLQKGIGNSSEFASVALYFLTEQVKSVPANIYHVQKGDHAFLIIGKGNDAVVCDAWAGEVYPENEIPSRLQTYKSYSSEDGAYVNVVTSYNPHAHSIVPRSKPNYFFDKLITASLGISAITLGIFAISKGINALTTNNSLLRPK